MRTTTIVGQLDLSDSIGTMLDCIQDETVEGALDDYVYAWKNGQQILIGARQQGALPEESVLETTAFVFMSKDEGRQHRRPTTWDELRALLAEGWVVGTDRKPGVKAWYPKTGRSIRRQMQDIYVFRQPRPTGSGDSIHIGSIENNTGAVAVGRGARATVINQVVQGLGYLQTQHEASVRNFLDYYVGTFDSPEPFGGREPDLAAYTRWLDDPTAPPYALLTASAGMGKSAALAHWVLRIEQRRDIAVVFFPISERFETNSKGMVLSALYARVAHLHGDQPKRLFSAEEYRGALQDCLTRPLPDGRRLLVVLDGLDETSGWEFGAGLFPTQAPTHLKVMVAAREIAGDMDWATRLGWRLSIEATPFGLAGLSRGDFEEVLVHLGSPLAGLRPKPDLVERLYELTDRGDPLMIRLYVDALRTYQGAAPDLRPEDLLDLKPGLGRFFEFWFAQQENLWRASNEHIDRQAVDTLINARAMALGPLTADDLDALDHNVFHGISGVRRVANAFRRFLVGTGAKGSGYSFSHPRLTQHFRDLLPSREREYWERKYAEYGAATLAALETGKLEPQAAPEYVIRHYRLHMEAHAAARAGLGRLVCRSWLRAWQELEKSEEGFLDDVQAAIEYASDIGPNRLGDVLRGTLCFLSARSLGRIQDVELLAHALSKGVINSRMALFHLRNIDEQDYQVEAILQIAAAVAPSEQLDFLREAMSVARRIEDESLRSRALSRVADRIADHAPDLMSSALAVVGEIRDTEARVAALSAFAVHLPTEEARAILSGALVATREMRSDIRRDLALSVLVARLLVVAATTKLNVLKAANSSAAEYLDEEMRARAANELAKQVYDNEVEFLGNALAVAREIRDHVARAKALLSVAQTLPAVGARSVVIEALAATSHIRDAGERAEMQCAVADQLSAEEAREQLEMALTTTRLVTDDAARVRVLSSLAIRLPSAEAQEMLSTALATARAIRDESGRFQALKAVAECLPTNLDLLGQALAAARETADERQRAELLCAVAARLPVHAQDCLREALIEARTIHDSRWRAELLSVVAERLPANETREVLREALDVARMIRADEERALALNTVAYHLPFAEAREALIEALTAARAIRDGEGRMLVFAAVADQLPTDEARRPVLREALSATREIQDERLRAEMLCAMAERLPDDEAYGILEEARAAARTIRDLYSRSATMSAVANHLPANEALASFSEALAATIEIHDDLDRALSLGLTARRLPPDALDLIGAVLAAARNTQNEGARVTALNLVIDLIPVDALDLLGAALAAVREIKGERPRAQVLGAVTARLPTNSSGRLHEALALARAICDDETRASALSAVAARLVSDEARTVFDEALAAARATRDEVARARALSIVAKRLPVVEAKAVLGEVAEAARAIPDKDARVQLLCEVARRLPDQAPDLLAEGALAAARAINDELERFRALKAVADWLPTNALHLLGEALAAARETTDESWRAEVLCAVTRRLPAHAKGYLREALVEARAIQDNCWRAEALSVLAERLPASEAQDVLGEALATACAIEEDGERASALSEVFKRLPADAQDLLSKALVAVRETQDTSWRVVLMNNMSAHLGAGGSNLIGELLKIAQTLKDRERFDFITRHSQYWSLLAPVQSEGELLTKLLFPPPRMSRGEFLEVLTSLIPVIHKAGGEHALHELVRAVRDTAEWWP